MAASTERYAPSFFFRCYMKINKDRHREFLKGICSYYGVDYYEFIRPSRTPLCINLRSMLILYYKKQTLSNKELSVIFNIDESTVYRNNFYAETQLKDTTVGKDLLKTIESMLFKQSIGIRTAFEQLMYERITTKRKT